ncbi:radical SAM family heme chaperone HemW [Paramylibacter ulvae]|nr:radical SAM family heme chaperone HemW [Amylibacter ulvae]
MSERVITQDWQNAGFGIYIHWPFCAAKCPYCDFNSHVRNSVDHDQWLAALIGELRLASMRSKNRTVDTVFFGGGTPSLMQPRVVQKLIETIDTLWGLSPNVEITLEANPTSVEAGKFADFSRAGINRVSMGVQALNDPDLKRLGRMHSVAEAEAAFDIAKTHFKRVSFDLIYARQDQTLANWETELRRALDMAVDHLSLYQLTIEPQTAFGNLFERGKLHGLPADDTAADMYDITQKICADAGMPAYEVSNHAAAGQESQHNLIYWRYGDYVGVGPGAHGRITVDGKRIATVSIRNPEAWLNADQKTSDVEIISTTDQASEYLMMSLRLSEGSDVARFKNLSGQHLPDDVITNHCADGLLRQTNSHIIATQKGRIILNALLRDLLV